MFDVIFGFVGVLFHTGIVKISRKYIVMKIVYIILGISIFVPRFNDRALLLFFGLGAIVGMYEFIRTDYIRKSIHRIKRIKQFESLFEELKLKALDGKMPLYIGETRLSNHASIISFKTLIPINEWQHRKELIQTYMNVKIIEIKQDTEDYQKVNLVIQDRVLAGKINWSDDYISTGENILNIGVSYYGIVGMNLDLYPHGFVAGETGSGKSNILKCMINQALIKGYEVILIDFKRGVSFIEFSDDIDICYDYKSALKALGDMVTETNYRLDLFREQRVDNLRDYNRTTRKYLPRKIIFIDELAELLKTRDKELSNLLYDSLETITRISRAVGINLIMGLQRVDSKIISGQIKNNVPYRICGRFVDKEPSRIMLGSDMASKLSNIKGRFIVKDDDLEEIQAFYFSGTLSSYPKKIKKVEPKPVHPEIIQDNKPATVEAVTIDNPPIESKKVIEDGNIPIDFDFSDIVSKKSV